MNMLREALTYLKNGWCVYPAHSVNSRTKACSCGKSDCPCPGKHPIGRWTDFQNRKPTRSEVKLWFTSMACNIGMVTGSISKVAVVDIDGEKGIESIRRLNLEPTLTARTGGGGYHLYYRLEGEAPSRVRILEGVDIRADRGYVVLPPSLHRSGRRYEWLKSCEMAPFDKGIFEKLAPSHTMDLRETEGLFQGVSQGSRNETAARLAGRYFNKGLAPSEVWVLLSVWNSMNNPPLPESELKYVLKRIQSKYETVTLPTQIQTVNDIMRILKKTTSVRGG